MAENGDRSISMELINKQTYKSACISNQIVYSDESNYKNICKELRSNTDTNFVLITHCEHDNIVEPINIPRNIIKWFVTDTNLDHHKKCSIPRGLESGPIGTIIPVIVDTGLGIFDNQPEIISIVKKSVICTPVLLKPYNSLSNFMIVTNETEAYITLISDGIAITTDDTIFSMYHDTPILLVEKWEDINKALLEQTRAVFKNKPFQMNTLTPEYWRQKIWKAAEH